MDGRGVCPDCGRAMQVRLDGAIRRHRNPSDLPCSGGGKQPSINEPAAQDPYVAELDEANSRRLRQAADALGLTLSQAVACAVEVWLRVPERVA